MIRRLTCSGLFCAAIALPASANAQSVPLSTLLVDLIQSEVRLEPPPAGFVSHEAHFIPGVDQRLAPYLFNQQLAQQLSTFPISSPAGGFAYTFDAASGTFERATNSFGPSFADRALTNGRSKLTFGANFQYSKYTSFEGRKLDTGDIRFYLTHQDVPGDNFVEGDIIQADLSLRLSSATTTFFANYGLGDRFDVAVVVPFVRVNMDATVNASILRLATQNLPVHSFPGGATTKAFAASGSATGVGDVLLRGKYRFVDTIGGGLAANIDLRLPTGDDQNLLGTGSVGATFSLIGSSTMGRLAPHFNTGFTLKGNSGDLDQAQEFNYKIGTELVATPTLTVSADLVGRSLIGAGRLELFDNVRRFRSATDVPDSITLQEYQLRDTTLNLATLALGSKFNVRSNLLLNASVLVALTDAGVTARVTPVVGFDFTF